MTEHAVEQESDSTIKSLLTLAHAQANLTNADPAARLAIVAPDLGGVRDRLEFLLDDVLHPALIRPDAAEYPRCFNFSLGRALADLPLIRVALDWLALGASRAKVEQARLSALLQELGRRAINELHVEAGAALNGALLAQGHVDELLAYVAPLLLGPGQPLADLSAIPELSMAARWQLCEPRALGDDIRLRLRTAPGNSYGHSTHG